MRLLAVARSAYLGSFSSLNRNVLFWTLALFDSPVTAALLVVGFATVTIVKSTIETPTHSMHGASGDGIGINTKSSVISSTLVLATTAIYCTTIAGNSLLAAAMLMLTVLTESVTSISYSEMTRTGRLSKRNYGGFILDAGIYAALLCSLVLLSAAFPGAVDLACVAFCLALLAFRLAVHKWGSLEFGWRIQSSDVAEFLRLCLTFKGFFIASLVLAINSNLYKYLVGAEGPDSLVAIYKIMSIFIVSDVVSSATKSNLLSTKRSFFTDYSFARHAVVASVAAVAAAVLLLLILGAMDVVDLKVVSMAGLVLLAAAKLLDALKGYVKTYLYVTGSHVIYFRSSLLLLPATALLGFLYVQGMIAVPGLIFALSVAAIGSVLVMLLMKEVR